MPKTKITVELEFAWDEDGTWSTSNVYVGPELDKQTLYDYLECDTNFFGLDDALYDHMAEMDD